MSLERFNQEGSFIASQFAQEKMEPTAPPIEILAEKLIDSAKRGISLYAESRFDKTTNNLMVDQQFWDGLFRKCSGDVGALVLGVGVVSIHRSLVDGQFSPLEFYSYWNSHLYNLPFFKAVIPPEAENNIEVFTNEKIREMRSLASDDPTLVSFFEKDNRHLRPQSLYKFIQENHLKKYMRPAMRAFKSIAQPVLSSVTPDDTEILRRMDRISHYDQQISYVDKIIDAKKEKVFEELLKQKADLQNNNQRMLTHMDEVRSEIPPLNIDFR